MSLNFNEKGVHFAHYWIFLILVRDFLVRKARIARNPRAIDWLGSERNGGAIGEVVFSLVIGLGSVVVVLVDEFVGVN